ncbi:hypothetical protein PHYBOEH_009528 [Phytophthora boehmeriae]|uniref:Myb-like DNA-binding protein n=1 Tax=Phytophthora boehmeriae TaxID=109152 RepID=A0A8T1X6I7_9STRA|nr:hypothetical protein PHYBOEH_009528 [Phytophthora boehmeriae]
MITGLWSPEEHAKFLLAIKLYPHGPWRKVAAYVGTRSIRQVQTHAQKYHEKVVRRMRGLHKGRRASGRREHRIDDDMLAACKVGEGFGVIAPFQVRPSDSGSQPQQSSSGLDGSELMMPLLLGSAPCPLSPGGVDSDGVVDTDIAETSTSPSPAIDHQLPTIDESLDFLIDRLLNTSGATIKVQL